MRVAGIALIVLGIIGLVAGGINYTRQRDVIDIGPIKASVQENKTFPIPPVAGVIALIAGVGLLLGGSRKRL